MRHRPTIPATLRRLKLTSLSFLLGVLGTASCTVDKAGLVFDDEAYDELAEGGDANGDGGSAIGGADSGGSNSGGASSGGETGSGGSAGEIGSGGIGSGGLTGAECKSGELSCDGRQVTLCSGGQEIPVGAPCEFVCAEGQCTGVCKPDTSECVSDIEVQTCDATGTWQPDACLYVCTEDACGGSCRPGTSRCGGTDDLTVEVCNSVGEWEASGTTCDNACDQGQCVGTCTDGDTQCVQQNGQPAELTCVGGSWEDGSIESCDHVCLEGKCAGQCVPTSKQCVQGTQGEHRSQACDLQGNWIEPGVLCPFDCQGGECVGECQPGMQKCEGDKILVCSSNYTWKVDTDCTESGLTCVALGPETRSCGQCNPGGPMAMEASCYFTAVSYCKEDGFWEPGTECSDGGSNGVCIGKGSCRSLGDVCFLGSTTEGCLDPTMGWWCEPESGRYGTGECDCSDGIACK